MLGIVPFLLTRVQTVQQRHGNVNNNKVRSQFRSGSDCEPAVADRGERFHNQTQEFLDASATACGRQIYDSWKISSEIIAKLLESGILEFGEYGTAGTSVILQKASAKYQLSANFKTGIQRPI